MKLDGDLPIEEIKYVNAPKGMPSSLKISGQVWTVKYACNLLQARNMYGITFPPKRLIVVDSLQHPDAMADTLLHEVLHMCLAVTPLHGMDDEQEEDVVRILEVGLSSVLKENKLWFKPKR